MGELGGGLGTSYPATLDTDAAKEYNSDQSTPTVARAEVENDQNAAIVAIEAELGVNPSGSTSDVKTFLQVEHETDGTHGAITPTSVVTASVVTDSIVTDSVVTASLALATGAPVTGIEDSDTLASDSATMLATQQSIKAYVDAQKIQISYVSVDYDLSTASGTQSITGAGFMPTSVEATAFLNGGGKGSFGNYDGTTYYCTSTSPAAGQLVPNANFLMSYIDGSGNNQQATISFTSDGGTLTWTKSGSPTGTLKMRFKFIREG
jgi:hypothetical protein